MQLKRLEAYGFKSFADKIEIEFDRGVTAIVGPNGSGKSNITDAIRWVLGERNVRNLRGAKAEDVIFTGSATRKAMGVAEVTLVFENEGDLPLDFREVAVTRRLFRTGDSEIFINRSPCRLKDIYNLFADTGIGRDGMSVIGQNRIDDILNSKPEDRRLFFEETAGITTFKGRKHEALLKLENVERNLETIQAEMHSIEEMLAPMAASAEKTRRYNEIYADYRRCALTELCLKRAKAGADLATRLKELTAVSDEALAKQTDINTGEAQKEVLRAELDKLENDLRAQFTKNEQANQQLSEAKAEMAALQTRQEQAERDGQRLREERHSLETGIAVAKGAIAGHKAKARAQQDELSAAEAALASQEQSAAMLAEKLQAQKEAGQQSDNEAAKQLELWQAKKNELAIIEHDLAADDDERAEQTRLRQAAEATLADLRQERAAWQAEQDGAKETMQRLDGARQEKQLVASRLEDELASVQEQLNSWQEKLHIDESRLQALKNLQSSYEGFGQAAKAVLKAKAPWKKGVCGAVAELLAIPPDYVTAMDVALGASQQNIVTEDSATAKQAIDFLKRERRGRVTFLPLAALVVRYPTEKAVKNEAGVIGWGNELVNCQGKYQKIADFLLARTLIMETLEQALAVAKKYGQRLRIVTLGGELISPGGALAGGSRQHKEATFMGRSKEIAALVAATADSRGQADACRARQQALSEQSALAKAEEEKLSKDFQAAQVHLAELRVAGQKLAEAISAQEAQLSTMEKKQSDRALSFAEAERQRVAIAREVRLAESNWKKLTEKTKAEQEKLEDLAQDAADLDKYINKCRLEQAVLAQAAKHSHEMMAARESELAKSESALAKNGQDLAALDREQAESAARIEALSRQNTDCEESYRQGKAAYDEMDKSRLGKMAATKEIDDAVRKLSQQLNKLKDKERSLATARDRLQDEIDRCDTSLSQDYELTAEAAAQETLDIPPEELAKRLKELKKALGELGEVNPNAVTEYENLAQRHTDKERQAADITAARENLQEIIAKLDAAMAEQFTAAFAQIQIYFGEIFVRLFGGGEARLKLTEPDDVLNSGVEIIVQLPQKKQQNLAALSGGERALTVIALLFSFLRYKPAPFSVLDEIDAPLDEANILRFGSFLREFAQNTQFIIVTHRKGTMESVDTMYGVTIEDAGVSRIISVKLDEWER